jgi:hypothetical protein
MTNIVKFPTKQKRRNLTPRKRVFYLSYRYVGPALCQEVQNIYLKRHGYHNGERRWSLITYASYSEGESKRYSIELESCLENDVPDMIESIYLEEEVTFSAKLKHIVSPIYDGLRFPNFVCPINRKGFGTKIMAQSVSARTLLNGEGVYSYTCYEDAEHGIIWMNLQDYGGHEIRAVPVQFVGKQSKGFIQKYFKKRMSK